MARASIPTLLSLDRFAKIMGIIPPHFNQVSSGTLFSAGQCNDIWYQYAWQDSDKIAREDLALEINNVEEELAAFVGYWPAPKFISQDVYQYDKYLRPELWQIDWSDVRHAPKSINLKHGKFIGPGRRAVSLIGTATTAAGTLVYADTDGDGYTEDATITLPTTLTNVNEVKAYFPGQGGKEEWEIRGETSKVIAGGFVVFHFKTWQMVDPDLWETYPTADGITPIDGTLAGNRLTSVDVYQEYRDSTQVSVEFFWNRDAGCSICTSPSCVACNYDSVNGCIYARDAILGIVVPTPAAYTAAAGWGAVDVDACRDPDFVKLYYVSGEQDERYLNGLVHDPLSDRWARMIAYMTVARLERIFCSCGNASALAEWLREDLTFTPEGGGTRYTTDDVLTSPFGTRRGEVMAWKQVLRLKDRIMKGVTI